MFQTKTRRDNALHRYRIALGHLQKVITMLEAEEYCIDTLIQSKAVQKSLAKADQVLLEDHLRTCVAEHFAHGEQDLAIAEVMKVFDRTP